MKSAPFRSLPFASVIAALAFAVGAHAESQTRTTENFDGGWRFMKDDAAGADTPGFDDTSWRHQDLPHDWAIEGPFDAANPATGSGAFLPGGVGWYRKHFKMPAEFSGKRVFVEFDGVMANSDVWINGVLLGHRPYGYISFGYELTDHLHFGDEPNVISVRADDAPQPASRWYAGAGIYRHVRLVVTDPVHLEKWGTSVAPVDVSADKAGVQIGATVVNQSSGPSTVSVRVLLIDPRGHPVESGESAPQTLAAGAAASFGCRLNVARPVLWGVDQPELYKAVVSVCSGSDSLDSDDVPFGIREFHFDGATGFWLNGENLKLMGVCLHDDASALGSAVPLRAWETRLAALRQLGVNAIRTAHNPPAPDFLDLCDRMGFLVMDEAFDCWTVAKNPYDYHLYFNEWSKIDLKDMVRRDRNHPSVILWSVGNEIHDTPQTEKAKAILSGLVKVVHENDPTRPVTQALFRPNVSHDYDDGLADMLDVVGTNYRFNELLAAQIAKPTRKIVGTENGHELPSWLAVRDNPGYSGEFIWSGIDYLGEARAWPSISRATGLLDRLGHPHADGSITQSWWSKEPMVYLARRMAPTPPRPTDPGYEPDAPPRRLLPVLYSDWTPSNSAAHNENVEVYSNCDQVELFLNGKSLGSQPINSDLTPRRWKVAFAPGELKAVGTSGGTVASVQILRTAGAPAAIRLSSDSSQVAHDWDDIATLTATVVDAQGNAVPSAKNVIHFDITGPGVIAAVDSADNITSEPFHDTSRKAFEGLCEALVRSTATSGPITLTASSEGLTGDSVTLTAVPAAPAH